MSVFLSSLFLPLPVRVCLGRWVLVSAAELSAGRARALDAGLCVLVSFRHGGDCLLYLLVLGCLTC